MWPFSSGWGRGGEPARPTVDVTVYSKRECPLCDEAKAAIDASVRRLAAAVAVHITEVDIAGSPLLVERYGLEVPVVYIAGEKRFFGHVSGALFEKAVRVAATRASSP